MRNRVSKKTSTFRKRCQRSDSVGGGRGEETNTHTYTHIKHTRAHTHIRGWAIIEASYDTRLQVCGMNKLMIPLRRMQWNAHYISVRRLLDQRKRLASRTRFRIKHESITHARMHARPPVGVARRRHAFTWLDINYNKYLTYLIKNRIMKNIDGLLVLYGRGRPTTSQYQNVNNLTDTEINITLKSLNTRNEMLKAELHAWVRLPNQPDKCIL